MEIDKFKVEVIPTNESKNHDSFKFEYTCKDINKVESEITELIKSLLKRNQCDDFDRISFRYEQKIPEFGYCFVKAFID